MRVSAGIVGSFVLLLLLLLAAEWQVAPMHGVGRNVWVDSETIGVDVYVARPWTWLQCTTQVCVVLNRLNDADPDYGGWLGVVRNVQPEGLSVTFLRGEYSSDYGSFHVQPNGLGEVWQIRWRRGLLNAMVGNAAPGWYALALNVTISESNRPHLTLASPVWWIETDDKQNGFYLLEGWSQAYTSVVWRPGAGVRLVPMQRTPLAWEW